MKAVFFALRSFAKILINKPVQVATDNSTVVAYINKQGGTRSWEHCALLWRILTWCRPKNIVLSARHIPGCLNVVADQLSRKGQALHTEWSLHPQIFRDICRLHGTPQIDLFATWFNRKLPLFVSPVPDPESVQVDAMSMDWAGIQGYAFPPVAMVPQVLAKLLQAPGCRLMLVAPHWPTRPWFLDLCQRSVHPPVPLPQVHYLLKQPTEHRFHRNLASGAEPACLVAERGPSVVFTGDELDQEVRDRVANPQRLSTQKVYSGKWGVFQNWCEANGTACETISCHQLSRFFLFLFKEKGLHPGTIQGYR